MKQLVSISLDLILDLKIKNLDRKNNTSLIRHAGYPVLARNKTTLTI